MEDPSWQKREPDLSSLKVCRMKYIYAIIVTVVMAVSGASALGDDYKLVSSGLKEPEELRNRLIETADFWAGTVDQKHGGFFTQVERDGTPIKKDKETLRQSRVVYAAVRAFQVTGDEGYLEDAEQALQFMYDNAWDEEHGGWYAKVNRSGERILKGGRRSAFVEHYALAGPVAMVEATGDPLHIRWLDRARDANDRLWDADGEPDGYFSSASREWTQKRGRGFTAEADAITAHLLVDYLMNRSPDREERLRAVGDNLIEHMAAHVDPEDGYDIFPYEYDAGWEIDKSVACLDIGHLLKTAWHLGRLHLIFGEPEYRDTAERLLDHFLTHDRGGDNSFWDARRGIPRGRVFWDDGNVYQESGCWWTMEQAITGGLVLWHISGRERYLEMADRTLDFFMKRYWDEEHGEAFMHVGPDGEILNETKASAFHTAELFYCAYLYGNLFYHERPVTLYYRIEGRDEELDVRLTPLAIPDDALIIESVELDGEPFEMYDANSRTLHIAEEQGGVFKVTFAPVSGTASTGGEAGD